MTAKSILVVGGNRGIGLELVKAFKTLDWKVYATVRPETKASGDSSIKEIEYTGACIIELDFLDESSIKKAAETYGSGPLDVLINCGGVNVKPRKWTDHTSELLLEKYKIMAVVRQSGFARSFHSLTLNQGPFLTSKYFLPSLKRSAEGGRVFNISSRSGSNSLNKGSFLAYRMAKAALNSQTVTLAREMETSDQNVAVIALYPGFVATKLTDFEYDDDMLTCVAGMVELIQRCGMRETGQFMKWDGANIPW
ncbi:hypothetical protein MMC27_000073 [Xylographa pallens]|nr:hypothetical protein [Xylographa pallens]